MGARGEVYMNIPANGSGQVQVTCQNALRTMAARGKDDAQAIPSGTLVRVVDHLASMLIVDPRLARMTASIRVGDIAPQCSRSNMTDHTAVPVPTSRRPRTLGVFLLIDRGRRGLLYAFRYKTAPSDKILVIYGSGPGLKGKTADTTTVADVWSSRSSSTTPTLTSSR